MYSISLISIKFWKRYIFRAMGSIIPPSPVKNFFYRAGGIEIGKNVFIGSGVYFIDGFVDSLITLEDESVLSPRVTIIAMAYPANSFLGRKYKVTRIGKVTIGVGAWLGVGTVVLPGVSVGNGAITGANAVLSKNIPNLEVWVGVPAKKIKHVSEFGLLDF
jgi:maltose O-acetyltransferase